MAKISNRKLFLFGRYSLALLIPKKWLNELGVEAGESVQLEFDKTRRRIVLRIKSESNKAATTSLSTKSDTKKAVKDKDADWQPIPQL